MSTALAILINGCCTDTPKPNMEAKSATKSVSQPKALFEPMGPHTLQQLALENRLLNQNI